MTPVNIESFGENCAPSTVKDPRWLQVEVCREFQRGKCTRSDAECRFAHPDETVQVENGGKVTACFDSMKDRCQRESCKYFHPPHHIKLQLEANGRLLKQHKQQLQALASQHMIQTPATVLPLPAVNTLGAGVSAFPVTFVSSPVLTTSPHSVPVATTNSNWRTEKVLPFLEVCQDYIKGICSLTESQCSSAHPALDLLRDGSQKRITVCMDFVKGRCTREACRYFHPPAHLQGKLKTVKISQSQVSLIPASSRKRPGESKDDLEEQRKQQALNYTLINTPLALPANFTTFVQPSGFQAAANAMQFAPAFFSTVPLTVPQFTTTAAAPYVHPQVPQDYNYILTDPGVFYGYQSAMPYYPNGCQYIVPCEQQLFALNTNHKHIQLPICRDYKSGNCRRDSCRYIHLDNRNVEVIDGKVTVCLDAAKGKCQRTECKYYHVPST